MANLEKSVPLEKLPEEEELSDDALTSVSGGHRGLFEPNYIGWASAMRSS